MLSQLRNGSHDTSAADSLIPEQLRILRHAPAEAAPSAQQHLNDSPAAMQAHPSHIAYDAWSPAFQTMSSQQHFMSWNSWPQSSRSQLTSMAFRPQIVKLASKPIGSSAACPRIGPAPNLYCQRGPAMLCRRQWPRLPSGNKRSQWPSPRMRMRHMSSPWSRHLVVRCQR